MKIFRKHGKMTKGKCFLLAFCHCGCYNVPALMRPEVLSPTADGCPSFVRREVMLMYVTYSELFSFALVVCAIISLVVTIFRDSKRK